MLPQRITPIKHVRNLLRIRDLLVSGRGNLTGD